MKQLIKKEHMLSAYQLSLRPMVNNNHSNSYSECLSSRYSIPISFNIIKYLYYCPVQLRETPTTCQLKKKHFQQIDRKQRWPVVGIVSAVSFITKLIWIRDL